MATKSRSYEISATPVTIFAHILVIAITTLVLVWLLHKREGFAFNSVATKMKIFNLHPFLMIVGFILIGGEAIMAYKSIPGTRKIQKTVHATLHLVALACGILGICVIFKFKNEVESPDMFTLHSWLGMITICLYGLQWLLGFFSYVFPGAKWSVRASFLPWHTLVGVFMFLLAVCTAESGLLEIFISLYSAELLPIRGQEALLINFTGLLLILFAFSVTLSVILPRGRL